jgi:hypothetical protein
VGEYIPTTSTINSAPRFDHDPTTGESLGLLVEEQRVNLLLRSAELDNVTSWTFAGGTLTANNFAAPDSTQSADTVTLPAGGAVVSLFQVVSCTASTTYTFSFYARLGTLLANDFTFAVRDDTNAAFIAVDIVPGVTLSSTQWNRVTYTFTTPVGCVLVRPYLIRRGSTPGGTVHFWGAQLEAGAFPTSYIPTTAASATRSADTCSLSGSNFDGWYRQDEGTFYGDFNPKSGGGAFGFDDTTSNERIRLGHNGTTTGQFVVVDGNIAQCSLATPASSFPMGTTGRVAAGYAVNDFVLYANSIAATPDTSGTLPTATQATIGNAQASGSINGTIRRLVFWPRRLPDSTLQSLTQ